MTQAGVDVPHRPRRRERGHGRGGRRRRRSAARRCTSETASASSSPTPTSTPPGSCATCSTTCPSTPARAPRAGRPSSRPAGCPTRRPDEQRKVYDVRDVVRTLVDGGRVLELNARWARNIVTGVRAHRRPRRRHRRQPAEVPRRRAERRGRVQGRALRQHAATRSGCRSSCSSTRPASCPARAQEAGGVIRHGAKLVHAFAAASVPRVTVVLRKAFGGAFIAMNSRELGADLVLAWPRAQLGVMGPKQAVDLVHRREIAAADDPARARERFADALRRRAPHRGVRRRRGRHRRDRRAVGDARAPDGRAANPVDPRKARPAGKEHPAMTLTMTRRPHADGPVLLTGATGFVGMELLVRLLEQTDRDVVALVRADDDDAAAARIDDAADDARRARAARRGAPARARRRRRPRAPGLGPERARRATR